MKVIRQVGEGLRFEFDADSPKVIFERLALVDSLFRESACGLCLSKKIIFIKRDVDNGCYLEMRCQNAECGAKLDFGQNKDGKGIFLKNWDRDAKRPLPNRGWYIYQKGEAQGETPQQTATSGSGQEEVPF